MYYLAAMAIGVFWALLALAFGASEDVAGMVGFWGLFVTVFGAFVLSQRAQRKMFREHEESRRRYEEMGMSPREVLSQMVKDSDAKFASRRRPFRRR